MRKLTTLAALLCLCSSAHANLSTWSWLTQYKAPNMHYGQLAFHPYYRLSETYDSNIFLVPHDQPGGQVGGGVHGAFITKNAAGLEANLPWQHINNLSLGYEAQHHAYSYEPSINNTFNQSVHADFVRNGAQGLTYRVGDQYVNTTDQAFSELIQRQRRWMNRAYGEIDYRPVNGRMAGGVDVSHETDKYLNTDLAAGLNRYQQSFGFNVGYMIQPKTKLYTAYHRGIIHYGVDPVPGAIDKNSKSHTVSGGVSGELTPKITGLIEAGMTYREYDTSPAAGTPRVRRSPVVETGLTYKPEPYTTAVLTVSRILQESIDPSNPFYYSNNAALDITHKFPHKFTAGVDLAMGVDKYLNPESAGGTLKANRRDDLYQGGVWLEYDIQTWLSTGLAYVYRQRFSTLPAQFNYSDNQTVWNAALKF